MTNKGIEVQLTRDELPEELFKNIHIVNNYPNTIKPVEKMVDTTAFFPGGKGLWLEGGSKEYPCILVLGQDFSTVNRYNLIKDDKVRDTNSPTWWNMKKLFAEAKVDLNKCFFSNVFMGLRDTDIMTGPFPGYTDSEFVDRNLMFLYYQYLI